MEDLVESQNGALFFLTAFMQRSTSQGIGDYVPKIHWRISISSVENFISIDVLKRKVRELDLTGMGEKEQKAVDAFQKALKRRREGKSDDDWRDDEG